MSVPLATYQNYVKDVHGNPLDNAIVILDNQVSGRSSNDGFLTFRGPSNETFNFTVYKPGYAPFVLVVSDNLIILNFTLVSLDTQVISTSG